MNLPAVRNRVLEYLDSLRDEGGPFGCYRGGRGQRPDLYACTGIALMRAIMGEDLTLTLDAPQRRAWIEHINSYADHRFGEATQGTYFDTFGHSSFHANGNVIGALSVLGGRQKFPVRLYDAFDSASKVGPWLEAIDWARQWPASHLLWGGMGCFSFSRACTPQWTEAVFAWLDANLDPQTGWWRRGVTPADRHQPLGGGSHIWPLYQHHERTFPFPERVIDGILALQLPNGRWNADEKRPGQGSPHHYLELDALYGLWLMQKWAPGYRRDGIARSVEGYADILTAHFATPQALELHPHWMLSFVGSFGLLQRLHPGRFQDQVPWTDIFSDLRLRNVHDVEYLEPQSQVKANA